MFHDLPAQTFDVILTDPPWSYTGQQDKWGAAAKFYETIPDFDLGHMPIRNLLNERSVLFMWATCPRLDFAIDLMRDWGLYYRGVAFIWVKTKTDGITPVGAQGVRPSTVKPTTELVLVGSTVKSGRPLPLADESIRQVVLAPRQEHSRKPDEVMERIEAMYPTASKLEMFARRKREGWFSWGNEIDNA